MCAHTLTCVYPSLEQALHASSAPAALLPVPGQHQRECLPQTRSTRRENVTKSEKPEGMLPLLNLMLPSARAMCGRLQLSPAEALQPGSTLAVHCD